MHVAREFRIYVCYRFLCKYSGQGVCMCLCTHTLPSMRKPGIIVVYFIMAMGDFSVIGHTNRDFGINE